MASARAPAASALVARSLAEKSRECCSRSLARRKIIESAARARSLAEIFGVFRTLVLFMNWSRTAEFIADRDY